MNILEQFTKKKINYKIEKKMESKIKKFIFITKIKYYLFVFTKLDRIKVLNYYLNKIKEKISI